MDEMTVRVLSDLARLYDNRSKLDSTGELAVYYRGGADALRQALAFLAPPNVSLGHPNGNGGGELESYHCTDCPKSFSSKQSMSAHRFQAHGVKKDGTTGHTRPHTSLKKGQFVCEECGKTYDLVQHLGMHRKRVHGVPSARDVAKRVG